MVIYITANRIIDVKIVIGSLWRTVNLNLLGKEPENSLKKALLERNSLRGICRIFGVSLTWLLGFVAALYGRLPADLGLNLQSTGLPGSTVRLFTAEADEM